MRPCQLPVCKRGKDFSTVKQHSAQLSFQQGNSHLMKFVPVDRLEAVRMLPQANH